jgi:hypothetical protein
MAIMMMILRFVEGVRRIVSRDPNRAWVFDF